MGMTMHIDSARAALAILLLAFGIAPEVRAVTVATTSAGSTHGCAVTATGGVKCWGLNTNGEIGDGTLTTRTAPVDVPDLASGVTAVATGEHHSCALTEAGGVKCWGLNDRGQLGDGTNVQRTTPVDVQGLTNAVAAITAGQHHTCALTASGGAKCWGNNANGQLGDNTVANRTAPIDVSGLASGTIAISAGYLHTCAITASTGAKCWGSNAQGQIGDSTALDRRVPVDVQGLAAGVESIDAGGGHTCAVSTSGAATCWGFNFRGQLGVNDFSNRYVPTAVSGLASGVASIATGENHTCAIMANTAVKCWGENTWGALGNGTLTHALLPADVYGMASGGARLALGSGYTCLANRGGSQKCWGRNASGQLGDGTTTDRSRPVAIPDLTTGVRAMALGEFHTCVLTRAGAVKCWGDNTFGQLGDATTATRSTPQVVIGLGSNVMGLAAGYSHNCVVMTNGTVRCWGWNSDGEVAPNSQGFNLSTPASPDGGIGGVARVSLGRAHSCAMKTDGSVLCWGSNIYFQLGNGTSNALSNVAPVQSLAAGNIAFAAGTYNSCAITASGALKCWGSDNNHTSAGDVPGLTSGFVSVVIGDSQECALSSAGGVKCWGGGLSNRYGSLGDGTYTAHVMAPNDVVGLTSGVRSISSEGITVCAVLLTGQVQCWGGYLLGGPVIDGIHTSAVPVAISPPGNDIESLVSGQQNSCGFTTSGTVRCWGDNRRGQLYVFDGTFDLKMGAQWISFAPPSSGVVGTAIPLSASATSRLAVAFDSLTPSVCTVSGAILAPLTSGACVVRARQAGDGDFDPAPWQVETIAIAKAPQSITFATLPARSVGQSFTASATSSAPLTVTLVSQTPGVCTSSGTNGTTIAAIALGTCTVRASQAGNASYLAASDVDRAFAVVTPPVLTVTTAGSGAGRVTASGIDCPGDCTETVGYGTVIALTAAPTGSWTFAGWSGACTGTGACSVTMAGNTAVTATFTGTAPAITSANGAAFTVSTASSFPVVATGYPVPTVTTASALPAGVTLSAAGVLSGTPASGSVGTYPLAIVAANGQGAAATQSFTLTVARKPQAIAFDMALPSRDVGASFDVSATGGGSGNAVTFTAYPNASICATSGTNGTHVTTSAEGLCTLRASQAGNGDYLAAPDIDRSFQVGGAPDSAIVITSIASMQLGACALTTHGAVKCWGYNGLGELGDGTNADRHAPVDVVGLGSGVVAIAAGTDQMCALTETGAVKCWGYNNAGQLGDGSTISRSTPVDVVGLGSGVASIGAGFAHTCALTVAGGVKCWGDNTYGQLGTGSPGGRTVPTDVVGLASGAKALWVGDYATCVTLVDGTFKCWGLTFSELLPDGSYPSRFSPITVGGVAPDVVSVSIGSAHACVVAASGAVQCWGDSTYGELGNGTFTGSTVPVTPLGLSSGMAAIEASYYYTCALTGAGGVKCWGYNYYGELGMGYTGLGQPSPIDMTGYASGVRAIAGGFYQGCLLMIASGPRCWGLNSYGGAGNDSTFIQASPAAVLGLQMDPAYGAQTITFAPPASIAIGSPATLTASVSSGLTVKLDTWTPSTCAVSDNVVTAIAPGLCGVRATQKGNASYSPAAQKMSIIPIAAQAAPPRAAAPFDLNGDGKIDMVIRDSSTGVSYGWLMNGLSITNGGYLLDAGSGWRVIKSADFNGDGKADLLIQHTDGSVYMRLMDGLNVIGGGYLLGAGTGYTVTHVADFNGDGKADVLMRHSDGSIYIQTMNGLTATAGTFLQGAGSGWTVTHVADFNGDGKSDILMKHADGSIYVQLMDGITAIDGTYLLGAGSGWSPTVTGDFNGDHKADILITHDNGGVYLWQMNGTTLVTGTYLLSPGSGWSIAETGDLDGDGKSDILIEHTDGSLYAWMMDGLNVVNGAYLLGAGSGWSLSHLRDLDGDGKSDILIEHSDGSIYGWIMNGPAIVNGTYLMGAGPWSVQP
jgi:alpha-tubulin suppressor-like RCC1 family protein